MNQPIYTLCLIRRGEQILLLNREHPTWMGRWNGIGGKLEEGETPEQSAVREIEEETGIQVEQLEWRGIVSWISDEKQRGYMHVFLAEISEEYHYETPIHTAEGILDWKSIDWILHPKNEGVTDSIPYFLPRALFDHRCYETKCRYQYGNLLDIEVNEISGELLEQLYQKVHSNQAERLGRN